MTESHTEEPSVVSSSMDVGQRLREAREEKKISIIDAAAQLRVTRDTIAHLEKQNWDKLHGRTYARGYFLSYVKFLGLPQDEMLADFNIEFTDTDKRSPSVAPIQQLKPVKSGFPWLALLLLILVAGMTWFVFQQWQLTQIEPVEELSDQPLIEPLDTPETDSEFNPLPLSERNNEPTSNSEELAVLSNENDEAISAIDPVADEASSVNTTESLTMEEVEPVSEASSGEKSLLIDINADCWVEVQDASQQVLISRVVKGGNTVELTGMAPFQISLGQANAASVRFDGDIIDVSEYTRGNVARFTLGEDS
ncbi:hypothetical protein Q7A_2560 [Methylophaga nitratireducenticrescens]|nr:RodZ domain-containing protein [Methylophaga nitratireducenticrescens]AFI85353.2 hypothetical protein Q7A_2560 [Methylophaga nitratireducenticrescens]